MDGRLDSDAGSMGASSVSKTSGVDASSDVDGARIVQPNKDMKVRGDDG